MRSLWSGVSGLQAHQLAMDVEGNNIANVNTIGFKYSRANFADMLSQTMKIATAPQGDIGGKNDMQVGLGTQVTSTTKIFSQGSTKNTDKNTDMTIQGDGFFIVSPDGGNNYAYTRNGDFNLDKNGTLVDANGFAAQGWVKELATGVGGCIDTANTGYVDSTQPIESLRIEPGLKIPANTTSKVELKANLNSGRTVSSMDCVCQTAGDDGIDFKNASDTLNLALDFTKLYSKQAANFSLNSATGTSASDIQNGTGFSIALNRDGNSVNADTASGATTIGIKGDGKTDIDLKAGDTIKIDGIDYIVKTDVTIAKDTATSTDVEITTGLIADVKAGANTTTFIDAFFVYTTGENGNPSISYSSTNDTVTPGASVDLNGGTADTVYFFKAPSDLKKSLEAFLKETNYGSDGVSVQVNDDSGTFIINNSPVDFNSTNPLGADAAKGDTSITLSAVDTNIKNGDIVKIGDNTYEVTGGEGTTTLTLATGLKVAVLAGEAVDFAKATDKFTTSRLYGFGGGDQQLEANSIYTLKNQANQGDKEVQLTENDANILVGDIITIGGEYVKVTSSPDTNNKIKFEPGLSRSMDSATKVIKYGAPDSMGDKKFTDIFNPLSGTIDKNEVSSAKQEVTKGLICKEDMGFLFNAIGGGFNLKPAPQRED